MDFEDRLKALIVLERMVDMTLQCSKQCNTAFTENLIDKDSKCISNSSIIEETCAKNQAFVNFHVGKHMRMIEDKYSQNTLGDHQ